MQADFHHGLLGVRRVFRTGSEEAAEPVPIHPDGHRNACHTAEEHLQQHAAAAGIDVSEKENVRFHRILIRAFTIASRGPHVNAAAKGTMTRHPSKAMAPDE